MIAHFNPSGCRPAAPRSFALFAAMVIGAMPLSSPAQEAPAPGSSAPGAPAPGAPRPSVPVVTPQGGLPERQPKAPRAPEPVPDSGATNSFSFQRAGEGDGSYIVHPADGSEGVRVSESFLGLVLRNPQISDEQRSQVLKSYPTLVQKQFDAAMTEMYPDASRTANTQPFQSQALGAPGGAAGSVTIEADGQAPGYVRISLATPDGQVQEFSASQGAVQRLLGNQNMTDDQKIQALKNFPFKLPEGARQNFKNLSREELMDQVAQLPELQKQEFVRMRRYYPQTAANSTTAPAENRTEADEIPTTVVERGTPRAEAAVTPSSTERTEDRDRNDEKPRDEGSQEARSTVAATSPARVERPGMSATAMGAIAVVAMGLLAAAVLAVRKGRQ